MKRRILRLIVPALCALALLAGCGRQAEAPEAPPSPPTSSAPAAQPAPEASETPEAAGKTPVDVDLTTLSSTMVFAEVSNLMYDPIPYLGKTVRMEGEFSVEHGYTMDGEEDLSQNFFYCIIEDALACCAQGLEFDLAAPRPYPEGYPPEGSEVTVVGTVELYEEGGFRYLRLADAVLESHPEEN